MVQYNNTIITSPINGVVSVKNVQAGEIASSSLPSYTIIDTSSMLVEIGVPDEMVKNLALGQKLKISINEDKDKQFEGVIDLISPSADKNTKSYTVKVKIDNKDGYLKAGMFSRVTLPEKTKNNVLTVPNEAVKMENGIKYIYEVVNDVVKKTSVTVGLSNERSTEISGDIKEGVYVITEGQAFLNDGDKVKVVTE